MKLYNADCLEVLRDLRSNSVDLVVTDPPYDFQGGGFLSGGGKFGVNQRQFFRELINDGLIGGVDDSFLDECVRVLKKINIYIWCNKKQMLHYMEYFSKYNVEIITWHKTNPVPTCQNKYLSDTEYLLFFRENGVKIYGTYHTKRKWYVTATNKEDKQKYKHPTIKPLDIIENIIINSSNEGDVVLDPFMGSGTTGVACKKLNRDFIGVEIDAGYFKIAKERIDE